jgi:regulatory protein
MILESVKTGFDEGVFILCFLDHKPLTVDLSYLDPPFNEIDYWCSGRDFSSDEEASLSFAASCCGAQKRALDLVHRAEQTRQGLTYKLERKGWDAYCVKAVVSRFTALELVSDARYARLWLRTRLDRKGGKAYTPRALLGSLLGRGISRTIAGEALRETLNPEAEAGLLNRFLEAQGDQVPGEEGKHSFLRNRLRYEGFSVEIINQLFELAPKFG